VRSVVRPSVCNLCIAAKRYFVGDLPLHRPLVSSYRVSVVTMLLSAAVWPQFDTQYLGEVAEVYVIFDVCKWAKKNYVYISGTGNKMFKVS